MSGRLLIQVSHLGVQHWFQTSVMIYHVISRALLHTFLYKNLRLTVCGIGRPTNEQSMNIEPSIPVKKLYFRSSSNIVRMFTRQLNVTTLNC